MGQKVNPIGLRLGIVKTWDSRWYAGKNYADYILEDYNIRKFIKKRLYHAGISKIEIERSSSVSGYAFLHPGLELSSGKRELKLRCSRKSLKRSYLMKLLSIFRR